MSSKRNLCALAAFAGWAALVPQTTLATAYTDEAAWRAAVSGVYALETFDGLAGGSDLTTLPALGVYFAPLDDGTQPTVQPYDRTGGVRKSNPNNALNDRDFSLPARGDYILFPINAADLLFGVGCWNVGGDDTIKMSIYDDAGGLIEEVTSPASSGFFGIVNPAGAKKIVISPVAGNGYMPIDDLQTAVRTTFIPTTPDAGSTLALLGGGLLGLAALRRRP